MDCRTDTIKPAGFEAVEVRSGDSLTARQIKSAALERLDKPLQPEDVTGDEQEVYQELRDRKVACFIGKLPQGVWQIRYECRAETPGTFHALPVLGHAMYAPEIRCNSAETRIRVVE